MRLLVLGMILLVVSRGYASVRCQEATRQVGEPAEAAIVRVIELLVASREISLDDLAQYATGTRLVNPIDFTTNMNPTRRHVFGTALEGLIGEVAHRGKAWSYIRRQIKDRVLPAAAETQGRRDVVQKDTRHVRFPIVIETLKPYPGSQGVEPTSTTFTRNGKTYLAYPANGHLHVVDLTTMTPKAYAIGNSSPTTPPSYFEENGQGYLLFHSFNVYKLNLDTGELKPIDSTYSEYGRGVMTKDGPRAVTSSKEGATGTEEDEGISIANPSDEKDRTLVYIKGGSGGPLALGTLNGKPHVALINKEGNACAIVDVEGKRVARTIPIKGIAYDAYVPQFYESKGGPRVLIPADGHFVIADPVTGKVVTPNLKMSGQIHEAHAPTIFEENGEKRALYASEHKVVVLDLETGKELRRLTSTENVTTPPQTFVFDGKRYYAWGTGVGKVVFMEADSQRVRISETVSSRNIREIVPVVHDNRVEAIVITRNSSDAPMRVQLIGPPRKP